MPRLGPRYLPARLHAGDPDLADRRSVLSRRPLYHAHARAYDALVASTGVEPEWVAGRLGEGRALIVDAGCGTGRHAHALAALGHQVIGVDRSPELIAVARDRVRGAELVVADLLEWRPPEPADAVLCRGVLNDLIDDGERAAAVRALHAMLRPGGVLLADVREHGASAARYSEPRHFESEHEGLRFESVTRFEDGLLVSEETLDGSRHEFRMRPWTRAELQSALRAAGFGEVEWIDPAEAGARDDRLVFSARSRA